MAGPATIAAFRRVYDVDFPDLTDEEAGRAVDDAAAMHEVQSGLAFYALCAFWIKRHRDIKNEMDTQAVSSGSVGDVSTTYVIPEPWTKHSMAALLASNHYGREYMALVNFGRRQQWPVTA